MLQLKYYLGNQYFNLPSALCVGNKISNLADYNVNTLKTTSKFIYIDKIENIYFRIVVCLSVRENFIPPLNERVRFSHIPVEFYTAQRRLEQYPCENPDLLKVLRTLPALNIRISRKPRCRNI